MKKIFILLASVIALTGCPKENEVKDMIEGLKEKKVKTEELIASQNFTTENLLLIQEYFFDFSEKVHLLRAEGKASESVAKMVKKSGVQSFCQDFFIAKNTWEKLNEFCDQGEYYACSAEMKEFPFVVEQFKKVLGTNFESSSSNIKECFN